MATYKEFITNPGTADPSNNHVKAVYSKLQSNYEPYVAYDKNVINDIALITNQGGITELTGRFQKKKAK